MVNREGFHIGCDKPARLMKLAGVSGRKRGRTPVRIINLKTRDHRPDVIQRNFRIQAPGRLSVADNFVRPPFGIRLHNVCCGMSSVGKSSVLPHALRCRTDAPPVEALEHVLTTAGRIRENQLIHHSDRDSQYVSLKYSTALAEFGVQPRVETVDDSDDSTLAEIVNDHYKAELIHAQGPWTSVGEAELAALRWVH